MPPYQYGNPANDFYLRNAQNQLYQQTQYPQQYNFPPQTVQPQIRASWVTNIEEARASRSDDFLSTNIFLDTATGKVYIKRIGNDGRPQFLTYVIEESPSQASDPLSEINTRLSNIEHFLGGLTNDKSVSGNADAQQSADAAATIAVQNEPNGTAEPAGVSKNAGNDFWKKRK